MMSDVREEAERLKKEFWDDVTNEVKSPGDFTLGESVHAAGAASGAEAAAKRDMLRGRVLDEARSVINGARQDAYGNPEDCFSDIAYLWNWWRRGRMEPMLAEDAAMMMALLKLAREKSKHKRDNVVDACGYLGLYEDLVDAFEDK